jgi:predicted KAP-like P-loop ATPase
VGSGKTSIINMTLEGIETASQDNKPLLMKFNPWLFSDQNQLIHQFFKELSLLVGRSDSAEKYKKIGKAIQKYSRFFEPLSYVPGASSVGLFAKAASKIGLATEKAGDQTSKNLSAIKSELTDLLQGIKNKIIIVIDDIDRLNNSEIRQIFQLVKSVADFPNIIYLLAFDKDVVVNALGKVQEGNGNDYLEKVIQVPFEIPQISESELEAYLLENLRIVLGDPPDGLWDFKYWGNMYHGGIKQLFKNIRDVNRYLNALAFGYGLVKGEVNSVDFVAVTAIQVFMPNLYNFIRDNKDSFAGVKNSSYMLSQSGEEEKTKIDNALKQVKCLPREILDELMQNIFPRLATMNYSQGFLGNWRKQGRVCSPDCFDIYFKLSIAADEIPRDEIERVLATGNDKDIFSKELLSLINSNKGVRFLERMEDYTREDIPEDNIVPVVSALIDVGDLFPDEKRGFFYIDTPMKIMRLVYQLTHRNKDKEKRYRVLKNALQGAERSLFTVVNEVGIRCEQLGAYGYKKDSEPPEDATVNLEQLDELVRIALSKIQMWAKDGRLQKHDKIIRILFWWLHCENQEVIQQYVESITKDENDLIEFIKGFLSEVQSHGMSDRVISSQWGINMESVGKFLDVDEVDMRLKNTRSKPLYNNLDDRAKLAVDIFLDTRDGKRQDVRHI